MNLFTDALQWIFDPANYTGIGSIPDRLGQHLVLTIVAVVIASIIAIPPGLWIGHSGRGKTVSVALSGAARAVPTLGLIFFLGLFVGIGALAPTIALVLLAIPPLLAGAYAGLEAINRGTIDAARAVGFTEWQILTKVEIPLGLPLIIGGIRSASLQVIATATLAAYVSDLGLGRFIVSGLATRDYAEMLGASILVTVLALVVEGLFATVQRFVVPRGVALGRGRSKARQDLRTRSVRQRAVGGNPIQEGNA